MRIHLPLHPHHFLPSSSVAGPSSSPLVHLGGELVIMELQGELGWEGDRTNGVVGVLGLDRPDKPTLYLGEHHLLHGKMSTLPKPYAVIRRVVGPVTEGIGEAIDGDAEAEEEDEEEEQQEAEEKVTPAKRGRKSKDDDDDDEPPVFAPNPDIFPSTPQPKHTLSSSSPVYPPSAIRDYSSELDSSSPARGMEIDEFGFEKRSRFDEEEEEDEDGEDKRKRVKIGTGKDKVMKKSRRVKDGRERTRHYEVVGVVRKKVVFALRPEPIVTATVLPE